MFVVIIVNNHKLFRFSVLYELGQQLRIYVLLQKCNKTNQNKTLALILMLVNLLALRASSVWRIKIPALVKRPFYIKT